MTNLKPVKSGWKWLEKVINTLVDAINARTISVPTGGGLDIQETTSGTLIALSSSGVLAKSASAPAAGPTDGAWLTIDVMDSSCHRSTIQVWSRPV